MPVYKIISTEMLKEWLVELKVMLRKIYLNPDKRMILYFIVSLYEYIQASYKLKILNSDKEENIKVTIKDISDYLNNSDFSSVLNKFKILRDAASHGFVSNTDFYKLFVTFLYSDKIKEILVCLNFDEEFINLFDSITKRLRTCFSNDYRQDCLKDCKDLLSLNKDGVSNYTISGVVNRLKQKYDIHIINSCIVEVVGSHYVIK